MAVPAISYVCDTMIVHWMLADHESWSLALPSFAMARTVGAVFVIWFVWQVMKAKGTAIHCLLFADTWPAATKLLSFGLRLGCMLLCLKALWAIESTIVETITRSVA